MIETDLYQFLAATPLVSDHLLCRLQTLFIHTAQKCEIIYVYKQAFYGHWKVDAEVNAGLTHYEAVSIQDTQHCFRDLKSIFYYLGINNVTLKLLKK